MISILDINKKFCKIFKKKFETSKANQSTNFDLRKGYSDHCLRAIVSGRNYLPNNPIDVKNFTNSILWFFGFIRS